MSSPHKIVDTMMANDFFSQWLGIKVIKVKEGFCSLQLTITKDMLNGFGIAHGGITYSLADSALAFASNSHGKKAVSIETSISHTESLQENDVIVAEAIEEKCSDKIGIYTVKVSNVANQKIVALFKGTVYRTSKNW